ncbi:deoxyguanosinetriphosphate triphosphohydrolase [Roseburia hominis]|jgi:dGTPase|uniref:deoxyguanosinetriphosphate triphosphohydrolase n=1 Tax=Roseburia hominis TaxID=301301 RepID=UPI00242ED253|nr:deoxyguanosinetriphosphate triphosphohydrolase [Roseburia hominis]
MEIRMNWEQLLSTETQVKREVEPEDFAKYPMDDLEKDYKAIISSAAFRRLQDKTQVFPLDKSDFVRTRLTHSLEVSTIARQLGIMITRNATGYLPDDFKNKDGKDKLVEKIPEVLSCAGLLHDLGNPPFGHFGEVVIGDWFKNEFQKEEFCYKKIAIRELLTEQMQSDLKNFEGNAQALRILSKIRNKGKSHEINLTTGVIGALIKYPTDSLHVTNKKDPDIRRHKLGYYFAEQETFEKVSKETGTWIDEKNVARHPLTFLMEAADDIAYSTADLEDALKKKMFSLKEFIAYFKGNLEDDEKAQLLIKDLERRLENVQDEESEMIAFQNWMDYARGWFMYCVTYSFSRNYKSIMNGEFQRELMQGTFHEKSMKIFKNAMVEFVYEQPEIVKLELSAKKIISTLLDDFIYAVIYMDETEEEYKNHQFQKKLCSLIPDNLKADYEKAKTNDEGYNLYLRMMMITDFISGMTDSYAKNLYQELNAY